MVNKIATILADYRGTLEPTRNDQFVASDVLRQIQEAGMLPPARTYEDWIGLGTETVTENTWQPE